VVSLGATQNRRGVRALELIGGVVLGLTVADLMIQALGTGPAQIGLMIVLAMGVGTVLGGSELLITEAAVSALLLSVIGPATHGLSADRFLEALTGGAVAFSVGYLIFPPDPAQMVGRAGHSLFNGLSDAIGEVSYALDDGASDRAADALRGARKMDAEVEALEEALETARDTARLAPRRRRSGGVIDRYDRTLQHLDYAVRNVRVLARHSLRYSRGEAVAPDGLAEVLHDLAAAVRTLGSAYDRPEQAEQAALLARTAGSEARALYEREPGVELTAVLVQARSLAADIVAAAALLEGDADVPHERPTEELLDAVPALAA
jgi:uncharacterized membrane protein YgaE (UPF0421/DUF939 family)